MWRVSSSLNSHITNHPDGGTTYYGEYPIYIDESYISLCADYGTKVGVSMYLNGDDSLVVAGVPAMPGYFGVVSVVTMMVSINHTYDDQDRYIDEYHVPTMNLLYDTYMSLTSMTGGGTGLPLIGTSPVSVYTYTNSQVVSVLFGSHNTSKNGATLSNSGGKLTVVMSLGSAYISNGSSGAGTVFVDSAITSMATAKYNNSKGKHIVPNTQAVFNYVSTTVPQAIEDYLATHTW